MVRMLVVCAREPDQHCQETLYGGSGARIVAVIGVAMVVEGDLRAVRETVKGHARVFGPRSSESIKRLLFKQPHLQTAVNMWRAALEPEPTMAVLEAERLAEAIRT